MISPEVLSTITVNRKIAYRSLTTLTPTKSLYYPEKDEIDEFDEVFAQNLVSASATLPKGSLIKDRWYDYGADEKFSEYLFSKVSLKSSRFSDGKFPVWYGSNSKEATVAEQAWHKRKMAITELKETKENLYTFQMVFFKAQLQLNSCIDIGGLVDHDLYHSDDYRASNKFAIEARKMGHDSIKFLSRRLSPHVNWAVFEKSSILESKAVSFWQMSIDREGQITYMNQSRLSFTQDGWCSDLKF